MSSKFKIKKLTNGVTLLMCKDSTKHVVKISITTKFGGDNTDFTIDDKKYTISRGMAHFLEHYLIEYSKYGNAFQFFTQAEYADFNGYTTGDYTEFQLTTPHDYLKLFKELLDVVNKPVFTQENIDSNKPAILEEINKKADDKFSKFYFFTMNNVFKNYKLKDALGSKEEINNLKLKEVEFAYSTFYKPNNQVIAISGSFDEEEVINLINNFYEIETNTKKVVLPKIKEPLYAVTNYAEMKDKVHDTYTRITYKIPCAKYKKIDLIKLDYYLSIYINNCFDSSSKIYQELVDKRVIDYGISFSYDFINNYLVIYISDYTLKDDIFIKEINNTINKREYDEEYFNIRKNQSIISSVIREDNPHSKLAQQKALFFDYNYTKVHKTKDYDQFSFKEYQEFINKLSFDNYIVTKMINEEKK